MSDDDPPSPVLEVVPVWAMHLSERLAKVEVKVNLAAWLGGASFVALLGIATILLTGVKVL
jgi:hypothetical protein